MKPISVAKIALALAGAVVFGLGIRTGNATLRWIAIGLLAMALVLRFVRERPSS